MKAKKDKEAIEDCNKSLELNDKYVKVSKFAFLSQKIKCYLRRAELYIKIGEHAKAVADYNKIKEIDPCKKR